MGSEMCIRDRTITIQDTVAPVITITNDTSQGNTLERFDEYVDEGATVDLGSQLTNTDLSNVQNTAVGSFDVVYTATDGNTTVTSTRTVTVVDTTPPVITLIGDNPYEVVGRTTYVDPGATADGGETVTVNTSGVNMNAPGNYTVTYSATDAYGNIGTASRTVTVLFGWNQQQKIQGTDTSGLDQFGISVDISDDGATAIVGAYTEDVRGAAYIFTRSGGTWTQQDKITASDKDTHDEFGWSVAISGNGNTAIVGARYEDVSQWSGTKAGAAYIFTRSGSTWTEQQKITASDRQAYDLFGTSVAISSDGDTAIVGADGEDTGASDAGAAYIFTRSGTTWTQQQKIQASDKQAYDNFGTSVAIDDDGNTAIVGAEYEGFVGSAYIFTRSGTTWSEQQKIQASDKQSADYFGHSVSISDDGNTAIVGAWFEDTGGTNAGAAYIFTRSGTTWTEQQKIQASDKQAYDRFGCAVALSGNGNTAIAGAPISADGLGGGSEAGAAYVFSRSGTTWSEQNKIEASDKQADDEYGTSVAVAGQSYAIVGAWFEDTGGSKSGAAYIYKYIT